MKTIIIAAEKKKADASSAKWLRDWMVQFQQTSETDCFVKSSQMQMISPTAILDGFSLR